MNNNGEFESGEVFIYTKDHLGSIRELSDMQQKPIQRYNYTSYGLTSLEKTTAESEVFVVNPYAYTARELDESGDYFYRARYYDAKTGRFLSQDPIGFAAGDSNLYRYANNNPMIFVDPYGLDWSSFLCNVKKNFETTNNEIFKYSLGIITPLTPFTSIAGGQIAGVLGTATFAEAATALLTGKAAAGLTGAGATAASFGVTATLAGIAIGGAFEAGVFAGSVIDAGIIEIFGPLF